MASYEFYDCIDTVNVRVTIENIADMPPPTIIMNPDTLEVSWKNGNLKLDLYKKIDQKKSNYVMHSDGVTILLMKVQTDKTWKKLERRKTTIPNEFENQGEVKSPEDRRIEVMKTGLYQTSSPDAQKAMLKSYVESGGKVLCNKWDKVKKRTDWSTSGSFSSSDEDD